MDNIAYFDFDLEIEKLTDSSFRVRVIYSPEGVAEGIFVYPFNEQELEIFFLRVGRPRRGVRRINTPEMAAVRSFGDKLYSTVFNGDIQTCLIASLRSAESEGKGLRIRLRLPPELMELPWEYLYSSSTQRFFSYSINTPIVRYLALQYPPMVPRVSLPLNVLVMISNPRNLESLDTESEWRRMNEALGELRQQNLIHLTRIQGASLNVLQSQLRKPNQYHVFHFIGHGGFDEHTEGVLFLEDEHGLSQPVSGNDLGILLDDHRSLKLAFLNTCEGARTSKSDPFAGVAQQLLRQRIPSVIAMQFEITDAASIILAKEFYQSLADGYPVDAAVGEARKALYTAQNDIEWGTPVLYMRSSDGYLFTLNPPGNTIVEESSNSIVNSILEKKTDSDSSNIQIDWVTVPSGTFILGSDRNLDDLADDAEMPSKVIDQAEFKISRFPITVAQFRQFVLTTGYTTSAEKDGESYVHSDSGWDFVGNANWERPQGPYIKLGNRDRHPVTCISYWDAEAFCQWAGVRLPTENEWEKAARGELGNIYPWGNEEPTDNTCNFDNNVGETTSVASRPAGKSAYGVWDMAGNVWEWTSTTWTKNHSVKNPRRDELKRVTKGGSFLTKHNSIRCAKRDQQDPNSHYYDLGFRVVFVDDKHSP